MVRALLAFEDQGAIAAALEWLAHAQNADGGFGDGGGTSTILPQHLKSL